MDNTELDETMIQYCQRVGSKLAIALYKDRWLKAVEKQTKSREIESVIETLLDNDSTDREQEINHLNVAFGLLLERSKAEEIMWKKGLNEIFEVGYQEGFNPASDAIFEGYGVSRPSENEIKQFFWEGD
jgi:hypothetical protein